MLEVRDSGAEVLGFNVVDVTVDCDLRMVTFESILDMDMPNVQMSMDRFLEVATPLAEQPSDESREKWRQAREERLRGWPMPGPRGAD